MSLSAYPGLDNFSLDALAPVSERTWAEQIVDATTEFHWTISNGELDVDGFDANDAAALSAFAGGHDGVALRMYRTVQAALPEANLPDGTDIGPQIAAAALIAENPDRPVDGAGPLTWALLARHSNVRVRRHAASNEDTPTATLIVLADDPDMALLLARNPACPPRVLSRLGRHPDARVRGAVAGHLAVPGDTLHRLRTEPHPDVRAAAARALDRLS